MAVRIINDGSCISILIDTNSILLNKSQIRMVEVVKNDTVRIDVGGGALKHIHIKYADVTEPLAIRDVNMLRDAIKAMLDITVATSRDPSGGGCECEDAIRSATTEVVNVKTSVDAVKVGVDTVNANVVTVNASVGTVKTSVDNVFGKIGTTSATQVQMLNTLNNTGLLTNIALNDNHAGAISKLEEVKQATVATYSKLDSIKSEVINAGQSQTVQLTSMVLLLNQIQVSLNGSNDYFKEPLRIDDTAPLVTYKGFSATANLLPAASATPVWAIEKITRSGDMYTYLWASGNKQMVNVWNNRTNLNYQPLVTS